MPSAAARRLYEDQIPSFMSVFDLDAEIMADRDTVTVVDPKLLDVEATCVPPAPLTKPPPPPPHARVRVGPMDGIHKHHDSTSTQTSESADSSPTTTLSTTDSSPLSDPSPSSSPDSPINLIPLSSYPATSFGQLSQLPSQLPPPQLALHQPQQSQLPSTMSNLTVNDGLKSDRPMTSPSPRRPRNMKGLSIQPPFIGSNNNSTLVSEPASPSGAFIKPKIPPMKKRPSQLSLNTNTSDLAMRNTTLEVPSSPAMPPILQRRALKHSASTPHMLSGLKSSTFGPPGGMGFPKVLERNESGLSEMLRPTKLNIGAGFGMGFTAPTITEEESPIRMQVANRGVTEIEHLRDETENNEDQKSPGYPNGPIAIYEDNVFLYLEPNADEAAQFDLVINVAREVRNPFLEKEKESERPRPLFPHLAQPTRADESPIPDTALTAASFQTAFEFPPTDEMVIETPTTPKATFAPKEPEYIHMLWDHNTDIAPDLMGLCEKVEKTTKEGKRVLIHCQQGASRSASLIIAYGLYKNPELSVNDAYYAAQSKSKWISPNMKLMYCLQDFHKQLQKKKMTPASGFRPRTGRSPTKHRLTLSADAIDIGPKEPLTAPIRSEEDDARARDENSPLRGGSSPGNIAISPGPSSAPSSFSWSDSDMMVGRFNLDSIMAQQPLPPPEPAKPPRITEPEPTPDSDTMPKPIDFSRPPPTPGFPGGFAPRSFDSNTGFGFSGLSFGQSLDRAMKERPKSRILALPGAFPDTPIERVLDFPAPKPVERVVERVINLPGAFPDDTALMSPRVEAMMNHPLREQPSRSDLGGMQFPESPPTPTQGLFSPREGMFPKDPFLTFRRPAQVVDPRSPPTQGEAPIVRSIDELL